MCEHSLQRHFSKELFINSFAVVSAKEALIKSPFP